jgi:phenylalanyl-tRNA synthetase alpha chain
MRWIEAYFPFTQPSWELEVEYRGKWLEVCGCGVIQQKILDSSGNSDKIGWAFGLGLERIAMVLFDIPDIRLFWSKDDRFVSQFQPNKITKFVPFSKYPACYKDISFWCDPKFHDNDFSQIVRDVAEDLVESVTLLDTFVHPKTKQMSKCYRIQYRSFERTLSNEEVDELHKGVQKMVTEVWNVEIR